MFLMIRDTTTPRDPTNRLLTFSPTERILASIYGHVTTDI